MNRKMILVQSFFNTIVTTFSRIHILYLLYFSIALVFVSIFSFLCKFMVVQITQLIEIKVVLLEQPFD